MAERPRLTNAELRVLIDMLMFKRNGHYDSESNRWVYDNELYRKLSRMFRIKKEANQMTTQPTTTKEALERETICANCGGKLYQTSDPNNIHWFHNTTGDVRCPTRFAKPVSAPIVAPVVDDETKHDYAAGFLRAIAEGLRHAIRDHGPITSEWIGSASKRVYSRLKGTKYVK